MPYDDVKVEVYGSAFLDEDEPDLRARLRRLPPLECRAVARGSVPCKVCGGPSFKFDSVDFNKYCSMEDPHAFGLAGIQVPYVRCTDCGCLFTTSFDVWSPEDFREFIYNDDYLKVDGEYAEIRPARVADDMSRRFRGAEAARILDYGSGAGAFARQMRQAGYETIEVYDPFSSPVRPQGRFDVITCFEVLEHSPDPRRTIADLVSLLRPDGCILLSQTLQPDDILTLRGRWWYLAPRNGHVSTFTEESLEILGREHGLRFFRGDTIYGFAGPTPNAYARIVLRSIGPSFSTVRLFAPEIMPDSQIPSTDRTSVLWHPCESLLGRRIRYTGTHRCLPWRARWSPVARLRVHVPFVHEAAEGFAASCKISLNGKQADVSLVRGELAAEFDAAGQTTAEIELVTPEPVTLRMAGGKPVGLAVPVLAKLDAPLAMARAGDEA